MFAAFYDKDFVALGRWTTYPCNKWTLKRKSNEFDELTLTTTIIEHSTELVYVGLHDEYGRLKYLAFSGVPQTKDNLSVINAVDLRQIFKQELLIDLTNVATSGPNKVKQLYNFLLSIPNGLNNNDLNYTLDLSELDAVAIPWDDTCIVREKKVYQLWELIVTTNNIYDCYVETLPDVVTGSIVFKVRIINELIAFKMSDFNEARIMNNNAVTNRVVAINLTNPSLYTETYYLLKNDLIVIETDAQSLYSELIIQPPRYETVTDESDWAKAKARAVEILAGNRFQAKVEINTESPAGAVLRTVDLNTFADVYGFNAADDNTSKRLPVLSIEKNEKGSIKVIFGRLSDYWF